MNDETLADFVLARIAERKAKARAATPGPWEARPYWFTSPGRSWASIPGVIYEEIDGGDAAHIATWDPAHVLAVCEVHRQIVEAESHRYTWRDEFAAPGVKVAEWGSDDLVEVSFGGESWERMTSAQLRERFMQPSPPSQTLKLLGSLDADHPDYREEWK